MNSTPPGSCASCGLHGCHLNAEVALARVPAEGEAWLLDERWEEFNAYLNRATCARPRVFLPWPRALGHKAAYAWQLPAASQLRTVPWLTIRRSLALRNSGPGARRQEILEAFDRRIAAAYAARITAEVTRLVVWQSFLPFLHLDKSLGGREIEVLLWRPPMHLLQATLDQARARHPESPTLADFRSDPRLVEAEQTALDRAHRIVTPHHHLAQLYPKKTTVLDWVWPAATPAPAPGRRIAFLGPTLGRRGAYVVRAALQKLDLPLVVIGRNLESEDFWKGVEIEERPPGPASLDDIGLLVAPALTPSQPRFLMQALQRGISVLATGACGLSPTDHLHLIDPHDADALAETIARLSLGHSHKQSVILRGQHAARFLGENEPG